MKLKQLFFICLLCFVCTSYSQQNTAQQKKIIPKQNEIIKIDSTAIQVYGFKILNQQQQPIDTSHYKVNYQTAEIEFKTPITDTLLVSYQKFPSFLTKRYSYYNTDRIVEDQSGLKRLHLQDDARANFKPFDGLTTMGSITRGVTVGNNQNAVTNSSLDLQITGKLSDKVSIRASLQDTGIPIQDGGYSQKLDEFDQIFLELFSHKWNIRAGDLFLENRKTRFLNFNKKVQGLAIGFNLGDEDSKTDVFLSGAFVRGNYSKSQFVGQEGNQGPYKLRGSNNELYVLVISGSERVYVNGILLTRGEDHDYVIDYNAGEVRFTPKFPITSEMRIVIEYQYSERNFSRFITYDGIHHTAKKWNIGAYLYAENDIKNQPLQQNLSEDQVQILKQAGDDSSLMQGPSAYEDSYSENKILYQKNIINGQEVFEYSNDATQTLYQVKFSYVGANAGRYNLLSNQAIGKIYEFVGDNLGDYNPTTQLIAPTKLQIATVVGAYTPNQKTNINTEIAVSNNDLNLYSDIDDENNKGLAIKFEGDKVLHQAKNTLSAFATFDYVEQNFKTVERLYNIEFTRDWNIDELILDANQKRITAGLKYQLNQLGSITYQFDHLNLAGNFNGYKQSLFANLKSKKIELTQNLNYLTTSGNNTSSNFLRNYSTLKYSKDKNWVGFKLNAEDNQQKDKATTLLTNLSQRFAEVGAFVGRGEKDNIYAELGYTFRVNDSLVSGKLNRVNQSNSFYLDSRLVQTEKSDLSFYANYRTLTYEDDRATEPSLNSRIVYNDQYFKQLIQISTAYETSSGSIAQQEFTYLEVEPTQGTYMWIDYNNNGIQELEEFEIATYPDLAKYVRVYLPNQVFLRTHQNRISQSLTFNFNRFINDSRKGLKVLSKFYNQTSFLLDQKTFKQGTTLNLNPFDTKEEYLAGLQTNLRNALFYNRGKQHHSVTYTYQKNKAKTLLSVGSQQIATQNHQIQYTHLIQKLWLLEGFVSNIDQTNESENYASKNFKLTGFTLGPKIGYLFNNNASLNFGYLYKEVDNIWTGFETLQQHKLYTNFNFSNAQKYTVNGEFNYLTNTFYGNNLSAAGFTMLESLMPGKNMTWRLLLQRNLTTYLDLNINYSGRKSENSQTIHTGSVQLRAFF